MSSLPDHAEAKERPILFSGPMVRAILEGRKSQTRRVIKPQPETRPGMNCTRLLFKRRDGSELADIAAEDPLCGILMSPYGGVELLWVRETWRQFECACVAATGNRVADCVYCHGKRINDIEYRADSHESNEGYWRPSIHMPRWASRITLEITGIRVERVQEISEVDAMSEGVNWRDYAGLASKTARKLYRELWDTLNAKPKPVKGKGGTEICYVAYPWSEESFALHYPVAHQRKTWRGKPLVIFANPFVWVIYFSKLTT